MLGEGKTLKAVRNAIDQKWADRGPSTRLRCPRTDFEREEPNDRADRSPGVLARLGEAPCRARGRPRYHGDAAVVVHGHGNGRELLDDDGGHANARHAPAALGRVATAATWPCRQRAPEGSG